MDNIYSVAKYLGEPYVINTIDTEPTIYRTLSSGYEIEVSGVVSSTSTYSVYVWKISPRELMGVYHGIKGQAVLKDILGYCATKYQSLISEIQVERED